MVQINFGGLSFGKMPVVKNIQYGTITIADGATTGTAAISSVNTANSMLIFNGFSCEGTSNTWDEIMPKIVLTNATTITGTRQTAATSDRVFINFGVVEFYPGIVKSNQSGEITISDGDTNNDATITSVNRNKSICTHLGSTTTHATIYVPEADDVIIRLIFLDSTTVRAGRGYINDNVTVSYQVVEFY